MTPANDAQTPVGRALLARGIPFREFRHPGPVDSLVQAAEERGQRPEQVVRSILFRLAQDEYLMVLVAGPRQIDWKALRRAVGQSRLTMASADEVRAVTGYEIGAVSPFALPRPLRVLLDESVLREAEVSIGSGERGTTVILSSTDLTRALGDVERVAVVP
jgi:Cys-tRNA(Pro) deacylase